MQRLLGQKTASCFQRCVGMDAFNATYSTTYEIDEKYGTHYHENFKKFLTYVQDNDLIVDGAMTAPKGNRMRSRIRRCLSASRKEERTVSWYAARKCIRPVPSTLTGIS